MDGIRSWIEAEGSGHWFFIAFPVVLLALLIWFKGRRIRFLIPSLLISIVIINPLFYRVWNELGLYAYWRILWVVPVIPVLVTLIPSITERIKWDRIKAVVTVAGVCLVVLGGTFLYNGIGGSFVEAANAEKLPDYVVQIADRLLEMDEHPRIIAQDPIGVYIRQYTGNIETLFGRDVSGYILRTDKKIRDISAILNNSESDLNIVSQYMLDEDYDYLILAANDRIDESFELVDTVAGYGIYKPYGRPSVNKAYDDLGRVISITTIDVNGNPIISDNGYTTIHFRYDERSNCIFEFKTDIEGNGISNEDGIAGFKREYDSSDNIIHETILGVDGNPIHGPNGYAEVKREYRNKLIISESYYDEFGEPVLNVDGFASTEIKCDNQGNPIEQRFYGTDDKAVNRIEGYSVIKWQTEERGIRQVHFYNLDGIEVNSEGINLVNNIAYGPDGWSEWFYPLEDSSNQCITATSINLDDIEIGEAYLCCIDVEFKGVQTTNGQNFWFATQGATDGTWTIRNDIWNSSLVGLGQAPEDGVYSFQEVCKVISPINTISVFDIGFRCDYWASGSFRVRGIRIEKVSQ